jgi:hypothetical protein
MTAGGYRIVTARHGEVIAEHTALTLNDAWLDILTDGLPSTMTLKDAWSLLGQITAEGGVIELPAGIVITVTRRGAR